MNRTWVSLSFALALFSSAGVTHAQVATSSAALAPAEAELESIAKEGAAQVEAAQKSEDTSPKEAPTVQTEPKADKKTADKAGKVMVRNIGDAPVGKRPWFVSGTAQYRTKVVNDVTPLNDQSVLYLLQGGYNLSEGLTPFIRFSLQQRFVAEEGDANYLLFGDMLLGTNIFHDVNLEALGVPRKISFQHRVGVFIPTSRASVNRNLVAAPQLLSRARVNLVDELYFGLTLLANLRLHADGGGNGPSSGGNTAFLAYGFGTLEYNFTLPNEWGVIVAGAELYWGEALRYKVVYEGNIPGVGPVSESAAPHRAPQFGADAYLLWVPFSNLALGVSIEQGADVLQNGIRDFDVFDREETQFAFTATGRY